ncbi:MAG: exo-alpha-sialidase [Candidatus Nealsonbacteria bacterium]|nr:exo-alpha-sialidase [Candidatus Nealsonbacteria bacterium]
MHAACHLPSRFILAPILLFATIALGNNVQADDAVEQIDVFTSGTEGYHTYRIPAVVLTTKNTLLAVCEGRKTGRGDHGDLDLVLRRSTDGGKTWGPMQLVHEEGGTDKITIGNPCPVVDRTTGTIWLPFCRNNDRVFITKSTDDGVTWAEPIEITADVKKPEWGWYATGPGHGIQLTGGRLVIPCDCGDTKGHGDWVNRGRSLVFYSDDHGKSWKRGGATDRGMNECEVLERVDGSLLLSMRNYFGKNQRAFAVSTASPAAGGTDAGMTWSSPKHHEQVYCPTCQSSIQRYSLKPKNIILYSGPGGSGRNAMTVRLSYDEGKTWPIAKVIYAGSAAYSDLVVLPDGTIGCLYERDNYGKISFARITLAWLTEGP